MKRRAILLVMLLLSYCASAQQEDLLVVFWNLENYFDWKDEGGGSSDTEFSSEGDRHWTRKRFYAKSNAIAKALLWLEDRYGKMPDVIGVAEVENRFVLNQLVRCTVLSKYDFGIIHYDSPDPRGIDVALIFNKNTIEPLSSRIHPVAIEGKPTRDILEVVAGDYAFLVNHHPSKYGGGDSAWKREKALQVMLHASDSLIAAGKKVVAMGDFNDGPLGGGFSLLDGHLENKAMGLAVKGEGSIRFNGVWNLIDMFFISAGMDCEMEIARIPFLMVHDNVHSGEKPLRTYSGPRWIGGVSDHCPVILKIRSH